MKPVNTWIRLVSAQAMLLLVPAGLIMEVELVAQSVSATLPQQMAQLAQATEGLAHAPVTCVEGREVPGRLTQHQAVDLIDNALSPTMRVNHPYHADTLFWSMENGLPFTRGTYAIYSASGALQDALANFTDEYGLCRRVPADPDADDLREAEERSQKWLDERTAALKVLEQKLADARAAFEADRIGLMVLAWTLAVAQLVGWVLAILVLLPSELKVLRERRARARAPAEPPEPARPRPSQVSMAIFLFWCALCLAVVTWYFDDEPVSPFSTLSPVYTTQTFVAFMLFLAFLFGQIGQGQRWALATFAVVSAASAQPFAQDLMAMSTRSSLLGVLGAIQGGLHLMALILLFTSPGADWFKRAPAVVDLKSENEDPPVGPA